MRVLAHTPGHAERFLHEAVSPGVRGPNLGKCHELPPTPRRDRGRLWQIAEAYLVEWWIPAEWRKPSDSADNTAQA
jgi:hypothetical protein